MNIESITLGQVALAVAFIVALVKGIDAITAYFKKPADDVEDKITKRLDKMEADSKMTLKAVYALLQHEVTGDHATDMNKLYTEISNYIIEK